MNNIQADSIDFISSLNLNITDFAKYIKESDFNQIKKSFLLEYYIEKKYNHTVRIKTIFSNKSLENANKIKYNEYYEYNNNIVDKLKNANFKNTNEKPSKIILEILNLDQNKFKNTIKFIEIFIDSYVNTIYFEEKSNYKKNFYDVLYLIWYNMPITLFKNNNDFLNHLSIWYENTFSLYFRYLKDILNETNIDKNQSIFYKPFCLFTERITINYEMNSKFIEFWTIITSEETYNLFLNLKDEVYENYNYNILI